MKSYKEAESQKEESQKETKNEPNRLVFFWLKQTLYLNYIEKIIFIYVLVIS